MKYLSIIVTIYLLSLIIPTIQIGSTWALLIMGLVLLIVNLIFKPILLLITLPVNLITLGLFSFIVNAWMIMIADYFVEDIRIGGFFNSLIVALIIVVFHHLLRDMNKVTS